LSVALALATQIPPDYWDRADDAEIATVLELLHDATETED